MCFTKKRAREYTPQPSISTFVAEPHEPVTYSKSERYLKVSKLTEEPSFVIIGAGAAGIACATELLEAGFRNVRILEASNRIGGRILTKRFADNVIDLGAQWCHGQENNVVYELVRNKNLLDTTGNIYVTFQCIRSNGEVVPENTVSLLKGVLSNIFSNRHYDLGTYNGSFGEYLTERFYEALKELTHFEIDEDIAKEFFENFKKMESSESSSGIEEVSAQCFNNYWECPGDYLLNWKDKGYSELFRVITKADEIGNEMGILEDRIVFDALVQRINWEREDSKVEVLCSGIEEAFVADHVIVTVSLGVLKECAEKMFEPLLPESKIRAIEGLGFGNVAKIFLEFPVIFWPDEWTGFATLWREEDAEELRATDDAWLEDVYGFYCVNYQPRVLVAWIVGKYSHNIEALTKEQVEDGCMKLLKRFLPTWDIPKPIGFLKTSWGSHDHFRGAYSFYSMKTEELHTSTNELAQPVTILTEAPTFVDEALLNVPLAMKPLVLFAGEATSEHYYSTVHGAVESGLREASRLAGFYSLDL